LTSLAVARVAAAVLLAAIVAASGTARADPRATIEVTVIEARKGPPFLHDALKPMWDMLKRSFGEKFAYYGLVQATTGSVDPGGKVDVTMPGDERFSAGYEGVTPEKGLLRVSIECGDLRTKVRIHDGGTFFQAGRRLGEGTLIVAVKATLAK
jgi:hypothetical protein